MRAPGALRLGGGDRGIVNFRPLLDGARFPPVAATGRPAPEKLVIEKVTFMESVPGFDAADPNPAEVERRGAPSLPGPEAGARS